MSHIKIKRGLDIPIKGKPAGSIQPLQLSGEPVLHKKSKFISLNVNFFEDVRFKLLVEVGNTVKIGQPLLEDKATPGRVWASPAGGVITEIRRGLKRRLLDIVIHVADHEQHYQHPSFDFETAERKELIERLKAGGLFAHIRSRPFNILASPEKMPKSIFVKAIESAPFVPPAELQVEGFHGDFQTGLDALAKLTDGLVHLVFSKKSLCHAFVNAGNVQKHTAEGPHPISSFSLHIQQIDPIKSADDIVWTLNVHDVIMIGHFINTGHYHVSKVVSIAGPGIISGRTGYFKLRSGYPIELLISNRVGKEPARLISGDPLTGSKVEIRDFLGFNDCVFCVIPEPVKRQFLHFFRLGLNRFSFSRAYFSGLFGRKTQEYNFTTSQHGEERAFIDSSLYDDVMPLAIPTMQLVKAVMAGDYDLAEELGLLEVDGEDFALPAFVCPSKIEMMEIIKRALKTHAVELLGS